MKLRNVTIFTVLMSMFLIVSMAEVKAWWFSSDNLTDEMATRAITKWLWDEAPESEGGVTEIIGIHEIPDKGTAEVEVNFKNLRYKRRINPFADNNRPKERIYSGLGKATFIHYNDGEWGLKTVSVPDPDRVEKHTLWVIEKRIDTSPFLTEAEKAVQEEKKQEQIAELREQIMAELGEKNPSPEMAKKIAKIWEGTCDCGEEMSALAIEIEAERTAQGEVPTELIDKAGTTYIGCMMRYKELRGGCESFSKGVTLLEDTDVIDEFTIGLFGYK